MILSFLKFWFWVNLLNIKNLRNICRQILIYLILTSCSFKVALCQTNIYYIILYINYANSFFFFYYDRSEFNNSFMVLLCRWPGFSTKRTDWNRLKPGSAFIRDMNIIPFIAKLMNIKQPVLIPRVRINESYMLISLTLYFTLRY